MVPARLAAICLFLLKLFLAVGVLKFLAYANRESRRTRWLLNCRKQDLYAHDQSMSDAMLRQLPRLGLRSAVAPFPINRLFRHNLV